MVRFEDAVRGNDRRRPGICVRAELVGESRISLREVQRHDPYRNFAKRKLPVRTSRELQSRSQHRQGRYQLQVWRIVRSSPATDLPCTTFKSPGWSSGASLIQNCGDVVETLDSHDLVGVKRTANFR